MLSSVHLGQLSLHGKVEADTHSTVNASHKRPNPADIPDSPTRTSNTWTMRERVIDIQASLQRSESVGSEFPPALCGSSVASSLEPADESVVSALSEIKSEDSRGKLLAAIALFSSAWRKENDDKGLQRDLATGVDELCRLAKTAASSQGIQDPLPRRPLLLTMDSHNRDKKIAAKLFIEKAVLPELKKYYVDCEKQQCLINDDPKQFAYFIKQLQSTPCIVSDQKKLNRHPLFALLG